ncbi:hypothetical protein N9543_06115 [Flavobacteriaceae bacterium]|nr:hypothetical protein [Flavobacteriaceae bacterium]
MNQETINMLVYTIMLIAGVYLIAKGIKDKKKGKTTIDDVIKNDPTLQKIDKEIGRLNKEAGKMLTKDRKTVALMKARGIEIDEDPNFKFDKKEFLNDFKSVLFEFDPEGFAKYDSYMLIEEIDERLKFEKRITKTNYSKFVKICEKLDNFWNEEYEEWNNFEDEDEMKELQIKKEKFQTKDIEIRNEIYDFISKSVVNK